MSDSDSYTEPYQDQVLPKVHTPESIPQEGQQSDDETMIAQSPSGSEDDELNKIKGMREQVRGLIHRMNIDEEVDEEEEIKDSHVEEKNKAKNQKKKVANAFPKKVAKGSAEKNKPVHLEESKDEITLTNVEISSELDIKSKNSKKGKTENINQDNAATISNVKPNKSIKVAKGKQKNDKKENHIENQSDLEFNKKENEYISVDTKNIPENNVNENIEGKKGPVKNQNLKENKETKGKPDRSLKKVNKEPITEVPQEKMPETEAIVNNTETMSIMSTRARTRNALNVVQENNESVEKKSAINNNTNGKPIKGQKKENLKKGGEQTNANIPPEANTVKDVKQNTKKNQNTAKEKASEKENNPTSQPKNEQTKSKVEEKKENKLDNVPKIVSKRQRK